MYIDTELRAANERVATVFLAALQGSKAGAGIIYQDAILEGKRFDFMIHTETKPAANYYGYSDIVYTGTKGQDSFLFTNGKKFDALAAAHGLSLRVVLNLSHADTPSEMLATLVHEVGVHMTRLWAAILPFNRPLTELKNLTITAKADKNILEEILDEQLASDIYQADFHHTEFGERKAEDYNELKSKVREVLAEWGDAAYLKVVSFLSGNPWLELLSEFDAKTALDEKNHEDHYWHPKVEYDKVIKAAAEIEQTAADFVAHSKGSSGLLSWLGVNIS